MGGAVCTQRHHRLVLASLEQGSYPPGERGCVRLYVVPCHHGRNHWCVPPTAVTEPRTTIRPALAVGPSTARPPAMRDAGGVRPELPQTA